MLYDSCQKTFNLPQLDAAQRWAETDGHHLLTIDHPQYPDLLRHVPSAPQLLYAMGELDRLKHEAIAIVGARNATRDGQSNAGAFAHFLSEQGWCIISGLAHGIDAAAHLGALKPGTNAHPGGTIAVLGTGIDICYPTIHRTLAEKILANQGLLLSEFPLGTPAKPKNFPRRNRIVAGLARGVLVIEAALRSGSLITARLAADLGREVFATPGSIHAPLSRGPHALIKQGAKLVESGADILTELKNFTTVQPCFTSADPLITTKKSQTQPSSPIWHAIGYDPVSVDTLLRRTAMLPEIMQSELLLLELEGQIARLPSGLFVRAAHANQIEHPSV